MSPAFFKSRLDHVFIRFCCGAAFSDTGAYGIDLGTNIGELMTSCVRLLEHIEEKTGKRRMLRLGNKMLRTPNTIPFSKVVEPCCRNYGNSLRTFSKTFTFHFPSGMTNPPYITRHLETAAAVLSHRNVFSFIHIPVQSGSTKVNNTSYSFYFHWLRLSSLRYHNESPFRLGSP